VTEASLFMVSLVVPEMDDAIRHYVGDWGFTLVNDSSHTSGHRWVEVAPKGGAKLRLVEASNDVERAVIGRQAGGRVAFFLTVANVASSVDHWTAKGIEVVEPERVESYGRVVVLSDKFGNRWDILDAQDCRTL
jgi:uncharacterized glyoxalase superfamily protein PhnB